LIQIFKMIRAGFFHLLLFTLLLSSCKVIKPNKPYLAKSSKVEIIGNQFSKAEKEALKSRLFSQQDDSTKVSSKEVLFIPYLTNPVIAYDSVYAKQSAKNMEASMRHIGYYKAQVKDTAIIKGKKVQLKFTVLPGPPTLIDTFSYKLRIPELQSIAENNKSQSFILKNTPVTKTAIVSEIARLVDSFRNNGYYRFTASELKMRGDSSIAALTTLSDDPFEQLELLSQAQKQRDSPTIKLALVIIKPEDTTKLSKFYINKIFVISDYRQGDNVANLSRFNQDQRKNLLHLYHLNIFHTALLEKNITLKSGEVYKQSEYNRTLYNLNNLGVWQNINIRLLENFDEANKLDIIVELLPSKKLTFENSIDVSYSAAGNNNNVAAGNLFGTSINASIINKNFAKEAIKMSHNFRFGIEFNNKSRTNTSNTINSNEASYTNGLSVGRKLMPKFLDFPQLLIDNVFKTKKNKEPFIEKSETFINTNFAYTNRFELFNLQTVGLSYGYKTKWRKDRIFSFKLLNAEFNKLYNATDSFNNILIANPFLTYSYNTSFVLGMGASYLSTYSNNNLPNSATKIRTFKLNLEESGLTWGLLPIINDFKRSYVKLDLEYKSTVSYKNNTSLTYRFFSGIGVPLANDDGLPFFKQFVAGGSNSMRGWPIRGIGRGGQKLAPFISTGTTFNDRTGDIQLETNLEYRHPITRLVNDFITLKGAAFIDVGNIWNMKTVNVGLPDDKTKFNFSNLYKQMGVSAGYGFRIDFTYLVLRTDFGFRFKRPETSDFNAGWKKPDLSFADVFQKIISRKYREWRYDNFNFSIGINYPF
jgi:outer membrane protein insertion porin family